MTCPTPQRVAIEAITVITPSPEALAATPAITWIGHATLLLRMAGVTLLTDPHLTQRCISFWLGGTKTQGASGPAP